MGVKGIACSVLSDVSFLHHMKKTDRQKAYDDLGRVANPQQSEGLKKPRAILLLWFLRNVYGIDDLEAYEYVCDGDDDEGIDGAVMDSSEYGEPDTIVLFQSKYPETPKNIGRNDLKQFVASAAPFEGPSGLKELLKNTNGSELERLLTRYKTAEKLESNQLRHRLVFVTAGVLDPTAVNYVTATNAQKGDDYLTSYDLARLSPIVEAFRTPGTIKAKVEIECSRKQRFQFVCDAGRVLVCAVAASEIAQWSGIDDRTLFDLNVRRELPRNNVRRALDRAIQRPQDHSNFLAFHNGLTVICDSFDASSPKKVRIKNLSVVNGAQSTIAFRENAAYLTRNLHIVVKFVEFPSDGQVAREVTVRSNTQNPVTYRHLRARDGIQLRLCSEFETEFPDIVYEVRPDASKPLTGHVIENDYAAQLLCAVRKQEPWLAVKRLTLFDSQNYPTIFTPDICAADIVLVDLLARRIERLRDRFPKPYTRSWQLTRLVAAYLVGQLLRTEPALQKILDEPSSALRDGSTLTRTIDTMARYATATLKIRCDKLKQEEKADDFKVDFKREESLRDLARLARDTFLVAQEVKDQE